jgi:hypothetical protein
VLSEIMFKKIFISIIIISIGVFTICGSVPANAADNNTIGFTKCNFTTSSQSDSISPCFEQIMTFLFIVGIFTMALRIAYIGINKFNPLDQNSEAQQVGLIRDTIIGLILLGAPALILGALNQDLLNIDFLNFSGFTGGTKALVAQKSDSEVVNLDFTQIGDGTTGTQVKGDDAVAVASIVDGKVELINVSNGGTKYKSAPTVKIVGGGGTGATAVAEVFGGVVTKIKITNPGSGYSFDPNIEFSGGNETQEYQRPVERRVGGISSSDLDASFQSLTASSVESGSIIKVLQVEANCAYRVFLFNNFKDSDCDTLDSDEFQKVFSKYPSQLRFVRAANVKKISSYDGNFTNREEITIQSLNEKTIVTNGYSYGSFEGDTGQVKCYKNAFVVHVTSNKYPDRKIYLTECGKTEVGIDGKQFTTFGVDVDHGFLGVVGGSSTEFRRPTQQLINGVTFPADSLFIRQITI